MSLLKGIPSTTPTPPTITPTSPSSTPPTQTEIFTHITDNVLVLEDDGKKVIKKLGIRRMLNVYHFSNDLQYFDDRIGDMTLTMNYMCSTM